MDVLLVFAVFSQFPSEQPFEKPTLKKAFFLLKSHAHRVERAGAMRGGRNPASCDLGVLILRWWFRGRTEVKGAVAMPTRAPLRGREDRY